MIYELKQIIELKRQLKNVKVDNDTVVVINKKDDSLKGYHGKREKGRGCLNFRSNNYILTYAAFMREFGVDSERYYIEVDESTSYGSDDDGKGYATKHTKKTEMVSVCIHSVECTMEKHIYERIKNALQRDLVILNFTQHPATPEQIGAGVVNLKGKMLKDLKEYLTFSFLPDVKRINNRVENLMNIIKFFKGVKLDEEGVVPYCKIDAVMIGGAPFLISELEKALLEEELPVFYAFSERVSVETQNEKGEVVKTSIFKHKGFVEKYPSK